MYVCMCVYIYIWHWDKEMDLFSFLLKFSGHTTQHMDLRSQSGTEPMPPALEAWGFITTREVLGPFFL